MKYVEGLQIITNNHYRPFRYRYEVPQAILDSQFDYLPDEHDGFFQYRGYWYHLSDFMRIDNNSPLQPWHGYSSDSYFSGIVIKISDDCETYQVGLYLS